MVPPPTLRHVVELSFFFRRCALYCLDMDHGRSAAHGPIRERRGPAAQRSSRSPAAPAAVVAVIVVAFTITTLIAVVAPTANVSRELLAPDARLMSLSSR